MDSIYTVRDKILLYEEGTFFYDFEEKDFFNIDAYDDLILNLKKYGSLSKDDDFIDKSIILRLFTSMPNFELIKSSVLENNLVISGISDLSQIEELLEDLKTEIIQLMLVGNE